MHRRTVVAAHALVFLGAALGVRAQARPYRIAVLTSRARPGSLKGDFLAAWVEALHERGYAEARDFVVEWRFAEGDNARLRALADELIGWKPDLIVASGTPAALALQKATSSIPIVLAGVADPAGFGLVKSLPRPGANITGTAIMATDVSGKSLELLRELLPALSHVAVLVNPTNPINRTALEQVRSSAQPAGVAVTAFEASTPEQVRDAFVRMSAARAAALVVAPDPFFVSQARAIVQLAANHRLPAIYAFSPFVDAGGLMCYGQSIHENYRAAATYIERIMKGAKPGELPVEQPTRLELVLNRSAAAAIGLDIPASLLLRADRVIP